MNLFIAMTIVFGIVAFFLMCVCIVLMVMLRMSYDQMREMSEPMLPPKVFGMWIREPDEDAMHGEQQ